MDFRKLVLYAVLAIIAVTLWTDWNKAHPPAGVQKASTKVVKAPADSAYTPPTFNPAASAHTKHQSMTPAAPKKTVSIKQGKLIDVKTDLLDVKINTFGGNIVSAQLLKYAKSEKQKDTPVQLLTLSKSHIYVTKSGITNLGKGDTNAKSTIQYAAAKSSYHLSKGKKILKVVLKGRAANGLDVTKTFIFKSNHYSILLNYRISNPTQKAWSGSIFNQVSRIGSDSDHGFLYMHTFTGAAISTPANDYKKVSFKDLAESNISQNAKGGWVAMEGHYFITAWVPNQIQTNHYYSYKQPLQFGGKSLFSVGYVSPALSISAGKTAEANAKIYIGPKIAKRMNLVAPHLSMSISYGWLWIISELLFWVMSHIYAVVGNWGWAIVLVTVLIKLVFFKLSDTSFKSMAKMRTVQPKISALKSRFSDDKQALSKATMELYRKEKINPLGGCLPMIIQIPVFIALYYVLFASVELRQAPFIFWIHNLAAKDPYYILPVLMGISMFLQQKLTPTPMEGPQAKMMLLLPVIFTVFFLNFPAGLVLYWLVNNCLQVLHQWYAMKKYAGQKKSDR